MIMILFVYLSNMQSGIYKIVNLKTGRMYIGSAKNLRERKVNHFSMLRNNRHSSIILQRAYNKVEDKSIFDFQVLEYCKEEVLIQRENFYLETLCMSKQYILGINNIFLKISYNILPVAIEGFSGRHRPESIQKMKENHPLRKDILIYKNGIFLKEVLSSKDASKESDLSKQTVLQACKSRRYITRSGYSFCFKEDKDRLEKNLNITLKPWNKGLKGKENLKNATEIIAENIKDRESRLFQSQLAACKFYRLQPCTINRCLKSGKPYKKYLQFRYSLK